MEEDDEDEKKTTKMADAIAAANLAQLKEDALARFAIIRDLFTKMGKAYEKHGYRSKQYNKLQEQISNELMQFRFSAKQVDAFATPCATWWKKCAATNATFRNCA